MLWGGLSEKFKLPIHRIRKSDVVWSFYERHKGFQTRQAITMVCKGNETEEVEEPCEDGDDDAIFGDWWQSG